MPQGANSICREPGCGRRCTALYCSAHGRRDGGAASQIEYELRRGSPSKRGYGRRWKRLRKMVLARDPLCKIGKLCNGMSPSTDADHIVPKNKGGKDTMENLQGACHECHSYKTATVDLPGHVHRKQRG